MPLQPQKPQELQVEESKELKQNFDDEIKFNNKFFEELAKVEEELNLDDDKEKEIEEAMRRQEFEFQQK